jgi:methyl-accepting chemotaxis protein
VLEIDQVNNAASQMNKVTEQNAANAEESASASEELSTQAESMNELVGQLVALVGGATSPGSNRRGRVLTRKVAGKRSKESELNQSRPRCIGLPPAGRLVM